ncbi:hypothetical protein L210DRAFT_933903 [Boletus edulis BED1]|uniref:Uncharacterized protein n=1 Tax=Boletus edulis BED1 TaxID=1328754 RepID=A0AAD4GA11_BOLED|nr:hypothetical protein L210DRAFT_933903 [Boletus edulis BED1]
MSVMTFGNVFVSLDEPLSFLRWCCPSGCVNIVDFTIEMTSVSLDIIIEKSLELLIDHMMVLYNIQNMIDLDMTKRKSRVKSATSKSVDQEVIKDSVGELLEATQNVQQKTIRTVKNRTRETSVSTSDGHSVSWQDTDEYLISSFVVVDDKLKSGHELNPVMPSKTKVGLFMIATVRCLNKLDYTLQDQEHLVFLEDITAKRPRSNGIAQTTSLDKWYANGGKFNSRLNGNGYAIDSPGLKVIKGNFLVQEFERLLGCLGVVYDTSSFIFKLSGSHLQFHTFIGKQSDGEGNHKTAKSTDLLKTPAKNTSKFSMSASSPQAVAGTSNMRLCLPCTEHVPIYDYMSKNDYFDAKQDLNPTLSNTPLYNQDIPAGSLAMAIYTINTFTRKTNGKNNNLGFNVHWIAMLGTSH